MSLWTLKTLRFLVPGILVAVVLDPLLSAPEWLTESGLLPDTESITNYVGYPIQVLLASTIYHVLDLRGIVFREQLEVVQDNIKDSLLQCCEGRPDLLMHEAQLRQGRKLMHVFYRIIDSDATLREKANRVRFNGIFWSSSVDVQIVAALAAGSYLIAAAIARSLSLLAVAAVLVAVGALSRRAMRMLTDKHLDLSNEQLEIITQHFCPAVQDHVEQLVTHGG